MYTICSKCRAEASASHNTEVYSALFLVSGKGRRRFCGKCAEPEFGAEWKEKAVPGTQWVGILWHPDSGKQNPAKSDSRSYSRRFSIPEFGKVRQIDPATVAFPTVEQVLNIFQFSERDREDWRVDNDFEIGEDARVYARSIFSVIYFPENGTWVAIFPPRGREELATSEAEILTGEGPESLMGVLGDHPMDEAETLPIVRAKKRR